MKTALGILLLVAAAAGCCKDRTLPTIPRPKVEEYSLPPPPK